VDTSLSHPTQFEEQERERERERESESAVMRRYNGQNTKERERRLWAFWARESRRKGV
jgi:hypothetical protein